MGGLFGGGQAPQIIEPAPLPERDDSAVKAARQKAQLADRLRRGRRATIVTGGQGVLDEANVDRPAVTTVLGGSA